MRRSGIFDLVSLHKSFESYGRHDRLLDYLAQPRISLQSNNDTVVKECIKHMESRTPYDQLPALGFCGNDSSIFKKRFDTIATNNRVYAISVNINPSTLELEEFSYIDPCWSLLFPLKVYLMHHPKQAKKYRGLLPFGSEVIKFYNESKIGDPINGTPSFADHVRLRDRTNDIADHTGSTTAILNNEMYLEGLKIKE